MAKIYKQSGHNPAYPEIIETWTPFEQPIPEWISDICKVKFIDGLGNITLDYRENNIGGLEFIGSVGNNVVIDLKRRTDIVCWGDNRLFTLRPIQLNLLYKQLKKENRGKK